MSQGDWQLTQGDALTRFLGSAAKAERFAEFYTGETTEPTCEVGRMRRRFAVGCS